MEHRCSPRVSTDIQLVISQYNKPTAIGRIKDATAFGFYIESDLQVRPLQQISLEIMLYRQPQKLQKYKFEAIVTHRDDHGFGVELEQLNNEQIDLLQDFIITKHKPIDLKEETEKKIALIANG